MYSETVVPAPPPTPHQKSVALARQAQVPRYDWPAVQFITSQSFEKDIYSEDLIVQVDREWAFLELLVNFTKHIPGKIK